MNSQRKSGHRKSRRQNASSSTQLLDWLPQIGGLIEVTACVLAAKFGLFFGIEVSEHMLNKPGRLADNIPTMILSRIWLRRLGKHLESCMELRHTNDTSHESRAWNLCSAVRGGYYRPPLSSNDQQQQTGNALESSSPNKGDDPWLMHRSLSPKAASPVKLLPA